MTPPAIPAPVYAALLRHRPGMVVRTISMLGAGLDHAAYLVNDRLVVRVSAEADPAECAASVRREAAVLALVAPCVLLPVPRVALADPDTGVLAYELLPGQPLLGRTVAGPERLAAALGTFLRQLHTVPLAEAAAMVPPDDALLTEWLAGADGDYREVAHHLPPAARYVLERFLAAPPPPEPEPGSFTLCHNDLGAEHILTDPSTGAVTGVIDWSDAAIADPMHDFGRLFRDLGPAHVDEALANYGRPGYAADRERIAFYARCSLIEDLAYGFRTGAQAHADAALANLARTFV